MERKRSTKKCPKHGVAEDQYCVACTRRLVQPNWSRKCTGPTTVEIASPEMPSPARTHTRKAHERANYTRSRVDPFTQDIVIRDKRYDKGVGGASAVGTGRENFKLQKQGACSISPDFLFSNK